MRIFFKIILLLFLTMQPINLYPTDISIIISAPKSIAVLPGSNLSSSDFFILVKSGENYIINCNYNVKPQNEMIKVIFGDKEKTSDGIKIPFSIIVDKNTPYGVYNLTISVSASVPGSFFSLGASLSIELLVASGESYRLLINVYNREGNYIETAKVLLYYILNNRKFFWMSSSGGRNIFYVAKGKYLIQCFVGLDIVYNTTIDVNSDRTIDIVVADVLISNVALIPPEQDKSPLLFILDIASKNPYIVNKELIIHVEILKGDKLVLAENVSKIVISGATNLRIRGFIENENWSEGTYKFVASLIGNKGVIFTTEKNFEIKFKESILPSGFVIILTTVVLTTVISNLAFYLINKLIKKPKVLEGLLIAMESPLLKVDFQDKKVKNLEANELIKGNAMLAIQNLINARSIYLGKDTYAVITVPKDFPNLRIVFFIESKEYRLAEKIADELSIEINQKLKEIVQELGIRENQLNTNINELIKKLNKKLFGY